MDYDVPEPFQMLLYPIPGAFVAVRFFPTWGSSTLFWETPIAVAIEWRWSAN